MTIIPFAREHIRHMVVQQKQQGLEHLLTDAVLDSLESGEAYTAMDGDEVLVVAGVVEMAPGRAIAWAYLSAYIGNRLIAVTRLIRAFLKASRFRRIEMDVDCSFPQAHRWAKMLGFDLECERRKSYTPDGRDCALYAMVKP